MAFLPCHVTALPCHGQHRKIKEHGPCHRTRTGRFEGEATCQSDNLFELWALDAVV